MFKRTVVNNGKVYLAAADDLNHALKLIKTIDVHKVLYTIAKKIGPSIMSSADRQLLDEIHKTNSNIVERSYMMNPSAHVRFYDYDGDRKTVHYKFLNDVKNGKIHDLSKVAIHYDRPSSAVPTVFPDISIGFTFAFKEEEDLFGDRDILMRSGMYSIQYLIRHEINRIIDQAHDGPDSKSKSMLIVGPGFEKRDDFSPEAMARTGEKHMTASDFAAMYPYILMLSPILAMMLRG